MNRLGRLKTRADGFPNGTPLNWLPVADHTPHCAQEPQMRSCKWFTRVLQLQLHALNVMLSGSRLLFNVKTKVQNHMDTLPWLFLQTFAMKKSSASSTIQPTTLRKNNGRHWDYATFTVHIKSMRGGCSISKMFSADSSMTKTKRIKHTSVSSLASLIKMDSTIIRNSGAADSF